MSFTPNWSVVPGEVATATKMSQLGANDDYLLDAVSKAVAPGTLAAFVAATPPAGWLLCDGSAVSRSTYADLFAVLGTSRGEGDGVNTFNLPNIRGRAIVGVDPSDADIDTAGKQYGSKNVTLTLEQMPAHNHSGTTSTNGNHRHTNYDRWFMDAGGAGNLHMQGGGNGYARGLQTINMSDAGSHNHSFTTSTRGASAAHNNMQPSDAEYIIIKY